MVDLMVDSLDVVLVAMKEYMSAVALVEQRVVQWVEKLEQISVVRMVA